MLSSTIYSSGVDALFKSYLEVLEASNSPLFRAFDRLRSLKINFFNANLTSMNVLTRTTMIFTSIIMSVIPMHDHPTL